jgi:hypothetical protein
MRVVTGKVVEGKVVVEGDPLEEGSTVTVLAQDDDEDFELTAEQEALLLKAIEEADQGDFIDGDQLLKQLDERV